MRIAFALPLVLAAVWAGPAGAFDMPKRKSGLWEINTTRDAGAAAGPRGGGPIQTCIDEKTDDMSRQMGENASKEMCSRREMRREGDRIIADSVCKFGETTATSRSVVSGKFDSGYEVDVRTKFDPPMGGMSESHSIIKARWLGPCKADQRPGDVIMPNGMKMNMFDAEKAAPKRSTTK
jgi:hypothetical protein